MLRASLLFWTLGLPIRRCSRQRAGDSNTKLQAIQQGCSALDPAPPKLLPELGSCMNSWATGQWDTGRLPLSAVLYSS
jgi:hypothetical protein